MTALLAIVATILSSSAPLAQQATRAKQASRPSQHSQSQVSANRLRPAPVRSSAPARRPSMVARAATGGVPSSMAEAPLDGSLVQQVGYFDGGCDGCGAVCDCDSGPSCGLEPICGVEASCGIEHCTGCGDPACGFEAACGVETMMGEPVCGMELYGQCGCDACVGPERIPIFLPLMRINWNRFQFFAGVQGFKGPMSFANNVAGDPNQRSGSGSFGFYEGFNEGRSLKPLLGWDLAAQLGARATQSSLSGSDFTEDRRNQVFVTAALFRRVDYGLQYGLAFDYLNDDWWFQGDLTQLRGELSWKTKDCHSFGFQFMSGLGSDSSETFVRNNSGASIRSSIEFEPTDQYRLFYRRLLAGSGDWSAFAGWTDNDDGLLGASLNLPLRRRLMLSTGATFLIPREGDQSGGHEQEGWNISVGLVFRPGGPMGCGRYCRPLFEVADNGTFLVDQR